MKINILFNFKDGPWGGGNQFLKALRDYLKSSEVYTESPEKADIILLNSNPSSIEFTIEEVTRLRKLNPRIKFVNRIDGPISLIRGKDKYIDKILFQINSLCCHRSIFQSEWSLKSCIEIGYKLKGNECVIINAPDPTIFYPKKIKHLTTPKVKIISTSWSSNHRKGFECYKWLDTNLDFEKFDYTFVGNSPYEFKNIKLVAPLQSSDLATLLRQNDIYITASQRDPCSNALIEALHCGLPSLAYSDGGHPEIIKHGGLLFNDYKQVPVALENLIENYAEFRNNIYAPHMRDVGGMYLKALMDTYSQEVSIINFSSFWLRCISAKKRLHDKFS